jgi:NAD(P)-dependent dehydrogenase (short-subunit alcohol dehydrogenase family)
LIINELTEPHFRQISRGAITLRPPGTFGHGVMKEMMMADALTLVTLIIGASRGLGLALAAEYGRRGWHVIATIRGTARTALHDLAERSGGRIEIEQLDITVPAEVAALRQRLRDRRVDLFFVNAGICSYADQEAAEVPTDDFTRMMVTNALSPLRVVDALEGLVPATGTIAVMSSELGSMAGNAGGIWGAYAASKAALNMLMRSYAGSHPADPRAMALVAPGWVRTEMGGSDADLSIEESIPGVVDAVAGCAGTPGLRFINYRGQLVPW